MDYRIEFHKDKHVHVQLQLSALKMTTAVCVEMEEKQHLMQLIAESQSYTLNCSSEELGTITNQ
jgi:heat shock protein HslJ